MQAGAGNAAVADLLAGIETGERPAADLLPGTTGDDESARKESERELKGAADRATNAMLQQRLVARQGESVRAPDRLAELASFERRLKDAREYGWLGTDAGVLSAELDELEAQLGRAEREEEASAALATVDLRRKPISERLKKAMLGERPRSPSPGC